jgi:hypothetical protein
MDVYLPIAEVAVSAPLLMILGRGRRFHLRPVRHRRRLPDDAHPGVHRHTARGCGGQRSQPRHRLLVSGAIAYRRRTRVDLKMGGVLAAGGVVGALLGRGAFRLLLALGQADLVVSLAYLLFLGVIGALMVNESVQTILRRRRGEPPKPRRDRRPPGSTACPFKVRFPDRGCTSA